MDEPLVCCVLLAHRPQYLKRALDCFHSQTYQNKSLISLDTTKMTAKIGTLRNQANSLAPAGCLIAHWDDDDWSAHERLVEQVAFMQANGTAVVGYCDMPFYDEIRDRVLLYSHPSRNYALGTSLMYIRELWEQVPFDDRNDEDEHWLRMVGPMQIVGCSSLIDGQPRMISTIHKGNTSPKTGARFAKADPALDAAVRASLKELA